MKLPTLPDDVQEGAVCVDWEASTFDDVDEFTHPELDKEGRRQLNAERRLRSRLICGGCPVQLACLRFAVEDGITTGMWGGLTPGEREQLRLGRTEPRRVRAPKTGTQAWEHPKTDQMVRSFMAGSSLADVSTEFDLSYRSVLRAVNTAVV